jgi:hypothetical protein
MHMVITFALLLTLAECTQEAQNKLGRTMQNWTGTNGVLEIYAGELLPHLNRAAGEERGVTRRSPHSRSAPVPGWLHG